MVPIQDAVIVLPETAVSALSAVSLASVLDNSSDCVKLVSLGGSIEYMNHNGLCAMEIDDFCAVKGSLWTEIWPQEARHLIDESCLAAKSGESTQFRAFCPTAKGAPRWWSVAVSPVTDSDNRIVGCLAISRDVTFDHQSQEALTIAAAEMKHRLRNTYQIITSLMVMMARGNSVQEQFAQTMADRVGALSRAQALFTNNDAPCNLDELIPALVEPFGNDDCRLTFAALPSVRVNQSQADAIALVIGELAANSAKHGAFAHGGEISVIPNTQDGVLTIMWRERCCHRVEQQSRAGGQGLILMEKIMAARSGSMTIEWEDHGLVATITLKLPE